MSPPWGGPSYAAKTFEVERDVGGLGCSMHQLLASAFSLLPEGVVLFFACWLFELRHPSEGLCSRQQQDLRPL